MRVRPARFMRRVRRPTCRGLSSFIRHRTETGLLTISLAGGLVYIVVRYTPAPAQIVAAYAIAWLLLLSGVRGILVRGTGSGDGGDLRQLTLIPRFIWFLLWLASTLAAVAIGGRWLVMRT
jgi:Peptidase M50B-like